MEHQQARPFAGRLAIIVSAIALVGAGCGSTSPTAAPIASLPSAAAERPSTAPVAAVIPVGRYVGAVQQVSDISGRLQLDASLAESERAAILDSVLEIRGARTYQTTLDVHDGSRFDLIQTIDGKVASLEHWKSLPIDERWFAVDTDCCGVQVYEVRRLDRGFQLLAKSPASSNVERFVRSVIFETGRFTAGD